MPTYTYTGTHVHILCTYSTYCIQKLLRIIIIITQNEYGIFVITGDQGGRLLITRVLYLIQVNGL